MYIQIFVFAAKFIVCNHLASSVYHPVSPLSMVIIYDHLQSVHSPEVKNSKIQNLQQHS